MPSRPGLRALTSLAALCLAAAAGADLTPDWVARLPVGASLSAGLYGMVVAPDGIAYVTGTSGSSENTDLTTAAFGPDGSLLWSATFDGPAAWHDQARGIALGADGHLYVTGNTPGPGSFANVLLLEYDSATGDLLDTIQYSSGPGTSEFGASVVADGSGNAFVAGGTVGDGGDAMVLAFDAEGGLRWRRTWDGPAASPFSGDHAQEILFDPNGDLLVRIYGIMASLHPDFLVNKYDPADGTTIWEASWGVSGYDEATDMEVDAAGDVYLTGIGIDLTNKFSTVKLDGVQGDLLWQAYDSAALDDYALALALDGAGGVLITGGVDPDGDHSNFNDNVYTVKRDAAGGNRLWTHLYGANCIGCYDVPSDVIVDPDGRVYVGGQTNSPPYSADAILMLLDGATGAEADRGIVSGGPTETAGSGILAFDAAFDLYDGGRLYDANTGEVAMSVTKWPSQAASTIFADGFESGDTSGWSASQP